MKGIKSEFFREVVSEYIEEDANSVAAPVIQRRTGSLWERRVGHGRMDQYHQAHGRAVKRIYRYLSVATRNGDLHKTSRHAASLRKGVTVNGCTSQKADH
ncbi:MAG: hypothetical protein ACJ74Y_03640 [Bryobacteraceae bacterium]